METTFYFQNFERMQISLKKLNSDRKKILKNLAKKKNSHECSTHVWFRDYSKDPGFSLAQLYHYDVTLCTKLNERSFQQSQLIALCEYMVFVV